MWLLHPNFKNFGKDSWRCGDDLRPGLNFRICANTFKYLVRDWNLSTFGNVKAHKDKLLQDFFDVQMKIMNNPHVTNE